MSRFDEVLQGSLFDDVEAPANIDTSISVSEVNKRIADIIKDEKSLSKLSVRGEISNFTNHITGHLYFTLKDEGSSVKAIMFKGSAGKLKFTPENGMTVTVRGDIRVFERDGQYQLYVTSMKPDGMGALYVAFLALRDKLEKEGLFTQKRLLPKAPRKIAVITAETGAAIQDILNILSRRNPLVTVTLIPALVQGAGAPASIIAGLNAAQSSGADVIIFGRGGGSIEDLQAFNDEGVARAVYASSIPTISAVGHEIDFTISDFVADLRAPTPSAAAELSVADLGDVYDWLESLKSDMRFRAGRLLTANMERIAAIEREIAAKSPTAKLSFFAHSLAALNEQIRTAMTSVIANKRQLLITEMKRVDALSPLNVLMRGYSIATDSKGRAIVSSDDVKVGDRVDVKLHKGKIIAKVEEIK